MPRTRSCESTTACSSVPIRQDDTGWYSDSRVSCTERAGRRGPCTVAPGDHSPASTEASGPAEAISRAFSTPDTSASRSRSSVRYPASMAGAHVGSAERSRTEPRECTRTSTTAALKASTSGSISACFQNFTGRKWHLQVGLGQLRRRAGEQARLGEVGGQRAAPGGLPLRQVERRLGQAQRLARPHVPDHRHERVVLQPAADPGQVVDDVDADLPQVVGRPDAREHQQLRGVDRARRTARPRAWRARCAPARRSRYSTPVARPFSTSTRVVSAPVRTVRLGRRSAGCR